MGRGRLEGLLFFRKYRAGDGIGYFDREFLAGKQAEAVAGDIPGRQRKQQANEEDEAEVSAIEFAGCNGARVRRQVDVHDRERAGCRQSEGEDRAIQAASDSEDDRQHHDETGIKENRKTHNQRG